MIIDISRPLNSTTAIYPDNPPLVLKELKGRSNLTVLSLGSHTGTHMDAPSHIGLSKAGTATYKLEQMIGPAQVADLTSVDSVIRASDLPTKLPTRLLLKTRNSQQSLDVFDPSFIALDESAARRLVKENVELIGIDGPSIKKRGVVDKVHELLLKAGLVIIEGLSLASVQPGDYELICLPLPIDCDGAPVRAILRR